MQVVWKPIPNYEGLYEVNNLGEIRTLYNYKKYKILTQNIKRGYYQIGLRKNKVRKWHQAHRLVAQAFIPNPYNLPQVNHKDENKLNNKVENLEWCTVSYNNTYGSRIERVTSKTGKPVYQFSLDGKLVKKHKSIASTAREVGLVSPGNIIACCKGRYETSAGYKWSYEGGGLTNG